MNSVMEKEGWSWRGRVERINETGMERRGTERVEERRSVLGKEMEGQRREEDYEEEFR